MGVRRHGAELERAIVEAVWAELDEVGFAAFRVDAVAERARTSKPVLYRRWPGRAHLVLAAIRYAARAPAAPDPTGSLRGDLVALMAALAAHARRIPSSALWGVLAEGERDPRLRAAILDALDDGTAHDALAAIADRATTRGELPARPGPALLRLPAVLVRERVLVGVPPTDAEVEHLVDEVVLVAWRAGADAG